jgi:integrase
MPLWIRGGKIYLDFRHKSRRLRPSTGLAATEENIKLAEQWDGAIQREVTLGTFRLENHFPNYRPHRTSPNDGTFESVASLWLESHKQSWAEWTYRKFKSDLEARITPKIGRRQVRDITARDLRLLREALLAEGKKDGSKLSNRSVNRLMQPVKAVFNELAADGAIPSNPAARLGKLKEKRIAEIDPFSEAETKALLKVVESRYRPYIEFLFESGFRPNEAMGLKWSNVNFVTGILSVRKGHVLGKDKDPKTEAAIRDVDITPGMLRALKRQRSLSYLAHSYVFITETGQPLDVSNFRARIWEPALKKATLKYRYPYQARHSFATHMIGAGRDPLWIANQMGTSLEMLFKHYAVFFRRKRLSQCDQSTDLSTPKKTKMDS